MATITGYDELSIQILEELTKGTKLKDIPSLFSISIDQAKRLSRFHNMLTLAASYLSAASLTTLKQIGMKSLYLSELFKAQDWEGLNEILSSVNPDTHREDLKLMIAALHEKRERIQSFKNEVDLKQRAFEWEESQLKAQEKELDRLKKEIDASLRPFQKFEDETKRFLMGHVGVYQGRYCLIKRVDSQWQSSLKKRGLIEYDEWKYINFIPDLDRFAKDYERRAKGGYSIDWDEEVEWERYDKRKEFGSPPPDGPYYRKGNKLIADSVLNRMDTIQKSIEENKQKQQNLQREMKKLRKTSVQSFMESVEAANTLSVRELRRHGEWQDQAAKWLFQQGYIVATEVVLPNGKRVDVIGYNQDENIVIIEVKASYQDFIRDTKWSHYLGFCDEFYFCFNHIGVKWTDERKEEKYTDTREQMKAGLLIPDNKTITVHAHDRLSHTATDRREIMFAISKFLSKKFVYGY